jgi:cellulose synthase/poly-beta-1,6-N-acetylglucosamine synthase-like glycosyltransferase
MTGLLKSLLEQDYPAEVIFVDDRSADTGPAMLRQFASDAEKRGVLTVKIITLKENPGLNKKQYALTQGLVHAKGDYFLFTDGDCEVPAGWIPAMLNRLTYGQPDEKTGIAIGPVFKKKEANGLLHLYQCYDHIVRYNYLAGSTGLGAAGGGFGNNLIISRKAMEESGGYDAIPQSVTEDAALISQIRRMGKFRIRAISMPDAAVDTAAEKSWRSFINQTLRWNNGGLFSPEGVTRFNYNLLMLLISTSILAIPLLPFFPGLWPLPAGMFLAMLENHIAVFALFGTKMPKGKFLTKLAYALFLLFMPAYLTLLTIMGYLRINTNWKGSKL